jgi:hypothetical protein
MRYVYRLPIKTEDMKALVCAWLARFDAIEGAELHETAYFDCTWREAEGKAGVLATAEAMPTIGRAYVDTNGITCVVLLGEDDLSFTVNPNTRTSTQCEAARYAQAFKDVARQAGFLEVSADQNTVRLRTEAAFCNGEDPEYNKEIDALIEELRQEGITDNPAIEPLAWMKRAEGDMD